VALVSAEAVLGPRSRKGASAECCSAALLRGPWERPWFGAPVFFAILPRTSGVDLVADATETAYTAARLKELRECTSLWLEIDPKQLLASPARPKPTPAISPKLQERELPIAPERKKLIVHDVQAKLARAERH
jgi:hypothetical protein